ncbi:biotin/lipoyl-binding protein [Proteiniborus sp. MB09-C3]|uniref:efflux RND transporter periplasmic adaptor subunit n=1 Tax=Proteiniborus sp. MB09-C3 TaxID=3050072 RepID=UPI002554DD39|nr:biotin/lipoyl-binding protein [Proteiniborus sp. MB09-C3]WIV13424.1 biotin/lipoyl-binding protein [Proteiniborus sp. MB09-C3]
MKKILSFIMIFTLVFSIGCSNPTINSSFEENTRPVIVETLEAKTFPILLSYIGTLQSKDLKKYSFKSTAKIKTIHVETGQYVKKGDLLIELDASDINKAVDAAKYQMEAAKAVYDKSLKGATQEQKKQAELTVKQAQDGYNFALDSYNKILELYEAGSISKQKLDEVKLQLDNAESSLKLANESLSQVKSGASEEDKKAAYSQYEQAKTAYEAQLSLLEDASLKSDTDGYIVDILYKEGELVPQGYPVIILRTDQQIITVGLSQQDVKKIDIGTKANITIDNINVQAYVSNVNRTVDMETLTYKTELTIDDNISDKDFLLGAITKVDFKIGEEKGIWIPIANVMSDSNDYVYIVEDEHVVRKDIKIKSIYEDKILTDELILGEKLIIKGMKNVKEGYKVIIEN